MVFNKHRLVYAHPKGESVYTFEKNPLGSVDLKVDYRDNGIVSRRVLTLDETTAMVEIMQNTDWILLND